MQSTNKPEIEPVTAYKCVDCGSAFLEDEGNSPTYSIRNHGNVKHGSEWGGYKTCEMFMVSDLEGCRDE